VHEKAGVNDLGKSKYTDPDSDVQHPAPSTHKQVQQKKKFLF